MNPIGMLMAFLLFGLVLGIGLFLLVSSLRGLYSRRVLHISAVHSAAPYSLGGLGGLVARTVFLLLGVAMIYQGALWIYIVVFR